jgi:AcrR family transcriptional regulator
MTDDGPPADAHVRRRDPERTKAALLDAARAEFALKGMAGARVNAIAERAGVNKQLISYYFGGKEGLYRALGDEWRAADRELADPSRPLEDVVVEFVASCYRDADLARMRLRETIDAGSADVAFEPDAHDVAHFRARRDDGEISDELDPAFVALLLQSIVISGHVFPADSKRMLGLDPGSPEHVEYLSDQLRRLVRRLR